MNNAALILGGASCVWDDVAQLETMIGHAWPGLVIAVNDIGVHWPRRLDHWCSLHPIGLQGWTTSRAQRGHPGYYQAWSNEHPELVDHVVTTRVVSSSGLFAVLVAKDFLGVSRSVLCGIPQTPTPHFRESQVHMADSPWMPAEEHWPKWLELGGELQGHVKSMSGRTAELLGTPTLEWLHG